MQTTGLSLKKWKVHFMRDFTTTHEHNSLFAFQNLATYYSIGWEHHKHSLLLGIISLHLIDWVLKICKPQVY